MARERWNIKQTKRGPQLQLIGGNNEPVFTTEPYDSKPNAERAITDIERIVAAASKNRRMSERTAAKNSSTLLPVTADPKTDN